MQLDEPREDVGWVDACQGRLVQGLVIISDAYEVVTEGNASDVKQHETKHAPSYLLISLQEVISRDTRLCTDRSQSCALDPSMVGHCEWSSCAIEIFPNHRNMLSLSDKVKPHEFKCLDNSSFGSVDRELGH